MYLRQSTAKDVKFGPFLDETDGVTAETALTITAADIRCAKNGGAFANKNAAQTLSHEEDGWYEVAFDTTDTNTLGEFLVQIVASGAVPVWRYFMVLPAMIYDSLVLGTDRFDTNVTHVGDTAQTARDLGLSVLISSGTGTGQLSVTSGVIQADAAKVGGQTASAAGTVTFPATIASATNITAGTITTVSGNVNGNVGGNLTGSAGSLATQAKADVLAEVNTAFDTAVADSVPADGSLYSVRQGIYMIAQRLFESSVTTTTLTVKKVNGSTSLMTFTLNDATSPTSITRAS